ncbi:MAG: hypothetical protein SOI56_06465 [Eubacteriales bacterium]|jgi:cell division protein FtsI/penicillin-binding protein 2
MSFKDKIQQPRMILRIFLVLILIATAFFILLVWNTARIRTVDVSEATLVTEQGDYEWEIEKIETPRGRHLHYDIAGWCIKTGEDQVALTLHVVLKNERTDEYLMVPTRLSDRSEDEEPLSKKYDYTHCCFEASGVESSKLNFSEDTFDVYLLCKFNEDDEQILIDTGETLYAEN